MTAGAVRVAHDRDAELMSAVQGGCVASFDILVLKYRSPVMNYIYRITHDYTASEDLAQEVFLRIFRSRAYYEPKAKFTSWLYRIATNVALNHRRDLRRRAGDLSVDALQADGLLSLFVGDDAPSPEQRLVDQADSMHVRRAVQRLPEKQRLAVLLHKYADLEYTQIARVLNTTVPAVKSLLFRAYGTLRVSLGGSPVQH